MVMGIYKSTDNGATWSALASTQTGNDLQSNDSHFDYISRIAVNPNNGDVYVAVHEAIYRSTDGGATWSKVLGQGGNGTNWADVIVTPSGRLYAAIHGRSSSYMDGFDQLSNDGVWTSTDGTTWTRIAGTTGDVSGFGFPTTTPTGWETYNEYGRIVLAYAPSNTDLVYAYYEKISTESELFKYDQSASTWTDLSSNISAINTNNLAGYSIGIAIKPDNANYIFIGGQDIFRSTDGFTTTSNISDIGGAGESSHHADLHALVFSPTDNNTLYTGSDGGRS